MMGRWTLLTAALCLPVVAVLSQLSCPNGFNRRRQKCEDYDECGEFDDAGVGLCGENTVCFNTNGSFYCQCSKGFTSSLGTVNFSANTHATCEDINECREDQDICGPNSRCKNVIPHYFCSCLDGFHSTSGSETFRYGDGVWCKDIDECQEGDICGEYATCTNTAGSYRCVCNAGYALESGKAEFSGTREKCEDICVIDKTICGNGTCHRGAGGHYCACHAGFTNYGNNRSRCTALDCRALRDTNELTEKFPAAHEVVVQLRQNCEELTEREFIEGQTMKFVPSLPRLLSMVDVILSSKALNDNRKVSTFLDLVETALRLLGPFAETPGRNMSSAHAELDLLVHKGAEPPRGTVTMSSKSVRVDMDMETAAGDASYYPGFTTLSLLSYSNMEDYVDGFFGEMKPPEEQRFKINSKVVTVAVSNGNTSHLREPVRLTFQHLTQSLNQSRCVFWDSSAVGGSWSDRGCIVVRTTRDSTVCSCSHLSSFAVLMALYEMENKFELQLITWVALSLSLICLVLCILTFSLIRSIQSPRTTIHLHLCVCLFAAGLIFLVGITRTENRVGCAVVAGLLHFFYLAAFCWMCLEGVQLFRMVVLVFNTNFKAFYMTAGGYGVPAVIVAVSALVNHEGYGTERHCWLSMDLIWSFFGPVSVIIVVNVFFFLITVWKLVQKFSSLNPDLDRLQKIKAFTVTAVAQLCVLGITWIFGCFQFEGSSVVVSYLFTVFGSLQGVLLFVMHCLFSKQVREEYGNLFSRFCAPQKKRYSEFGYSSKANASKSTQDTGESQV